MKRLLAYTILGMVCLSLLYSCGDSGGGITGPEDPDDDDSTNTENSLKLPKKEMRAVWMATVYGLDWPQGDYDQASQKEQYISYLEKFKELNINTVFFQVKGMGDAFYNSSYEPWSEYITGTRGEDPGYDILQFLIEEAHARGIEFHAWMNPYRIDTRANSGTPFADLHPSVKPEWVKDLEKIQIYNPALPEVRQRLTDIVKELITRYDVDGVHFDDYFYPAGEQYADQDDYDKYGSEYSTIEDFRRANVNKAIQAVYNTIIDTKPELVFSVSPAANGDYNYNSLFADVTKWTQEGWVDVIIPQLYQEIGNQYNDFRSNLNYWSQYSYKAALMIGHGYYKFGNPNMPAAFQSPDELEKQFKLTRRNNKVKGNALYSARYIFLNKVGITDKLAEIYKDPAVIPFLGREIAGLPEKAKNVQVEGGELNWISTNNARSVVYYFADKDAVGTVLTVTEKNSFNISDSGYYSVTTLNADNVESEPSELVEFE